VVAFDSAGRRQWITGWGLSDLERETPNDSLTVFEAGSVSKQFTAAAVLLLARSGRLSLDEDIRRYLPELPDLGRTTVREVLTHQSGWRDWRDLVEMTRWPSGTAAWTLADAMALFERQRGLNFPPGTEYGYSNTNYVLATLLVERITGETLRAFTQRTVFAPLGMHRTLWRDSLAEVVPRRALPWSPAGAGRYVLDLPFETVVGPGGLLTTAPDLMKWLANFETELVGGPGFTAEMERLGVLRGGRATAYAMGLDVSHLDGERVVSHAGWTGGYVAYAGRLPARRLALGILCNGSGVNTEALGPALLARLARLRPPREVEQALGESARSGLEANAAGVYRSLRTLQPVTLRGFTRGVALNGQAGYERTTDGTYVSRDGQRRLEFTAHTGAPSGFRIITRDGDSVSYARVDPTLPATASQLDEYVGRYRNDETGGVIELRRTGERLMAWRGGVLRDAVVPLFRDGFRVPTQSWILTIQRTSAGTITGFDLGLPRMRRLSFTKLDGQER
jgi:CubicO group peptidase (beta-lactamase class C family)